MRFAEKDGNRILPSPFENNAICPLCKSSVIAKCGKIKVWHWSHKTNKDCDNWGNRETAWHLNWKNEFPDECQEIIVNNHRADVKMNDIVIEFQNSSISIEDINERENHYSKMKWVLNGLVFAQNLILRNKNGFKSFRWKWPPKTWLNACCPIYIDMQPLVEIWIKQLFNLQNELQKDIPVYKYDLEAERKLLEKKICEYSGKLFLIKKVYNSLPCGGWGKIISKENFIQEMNDGYYRN